MTEFGILGPLVVVHAGEEVRLGGTRQRAVLARLLLDAGRAMRCVAAAWRTDAVSGGVAPDPRASCGPAG